MNKIRWICVFHGLGQPYQVTCCSDASKVIYKKSLNSQQSMSEIELEEIAIEFKDMQNSSTKKQNSVHHFINQVHWWIMILEYITYANCSQYLIDTATLTEKWPTMDGVYGKNAATKLSSSGVPLISQLLHPFFNYSIWNKQAKEQENCNWEYDELYCSY